MIMILRICQKAEGGTCTLSLQARADATLPPCVFLCTHHADDGIVISAGHQQRQQLGLRHLPLAQLDHHLSRVVIVSSHSPARVER